MTQIHFTLVLHWTEVWATGNTLQRLPESYKAGIISWWNLLDPFGVPTLTPWDLHAGSLLLCGRILLCSVATSRKPLWRNLQTIAVTSRWREDWQSATVVNSNLVVDPTIRLPGFDLHRRQWSLLNRFWSGQGHCNACHKKWGFTDNELWLEKSRHCHTSSTLVHWPNLTAVYCAYNKAAVNWLTTWLLAHDNNKLITTTSLMTYTYTLPGQLIGLCHSLGGDFMYPCNRFRASCIEGVISCSSLPVNSYSCHGH